MIAPTSQQSESKKQLDDLRAQYPEQTKQFESAFRMASLYESFSVRDWWEMITAALEANGPAGRKSVAYVLAVLTHVGFGTYNDVRKRHVANNEIPPRKLFWVIGTAMQEIGAQLRGDSTPNTKGRVNQGLIDVIRIVSQHEIKKLTYRELKDALEYVLIHVSDENALRLFVYRAKKRGWL